MFSDGEDNASHHSLSDAIEAAQTADTLIFAVRYSAFSLGIGAAIQRMKGNHAMERMARETGANSFDASKGDVKESLAQIGEELRNLYEVGYSTSRDAQQRKFRKITVRGEATRSGGAGEERIFPQVTLPP